MAKKNNKQSLLTFKDFEDIFNGFKSDKDRIKYMSKAYKNMNRFLSQDVPNSSSPEPLL